MSNPVYQHWIELGEKLGVIVSTLHENIKTFKIVYTGEVLQSASKLLVAALSLGVARGRKMDANLISACSVLKENVIEVNVLFFYLFVLTLFFITSYLSGTVAI